METKDAQRTKGTVYFLGNGYYKEFKFGSIHGKVGDFVLVANEDSPFPDTVAGSDVAEILELYEARDRTEDPWRAVVRWFSRPHEVPKKLIGHLNLNKDCEIVQDNRDFDNDVSVETFFSICQVITADVDEDPAAIVKEHMMLSDKPTFVCRYKLTAGRKQKIKPYLQHKVNSPTFIHKSDRVRIERSQIPKQESRQKSWVESSNVKRISLPDSDRSRSVSPAIPLTDGTSGSSSSDESVKNVVISPKKDQRSASTMVVEETDEELNYRKEHFSEPSMRWYGVEDEKKGFEVNMLPVKSSRTPNKGNEQKTVNDVSRVKKYSFVRKLKDEDFMKLLENDDDDDDDDDSGHEQNPLINNSCSPSQKALKELGTSPNMLSSSKECSRSSIKMNQSAKKKLFQSELNSESSNASEDMNSKPRKNETLTAQETIYKPQGIPDEMVSSTSRKRKRESRDNDEGLLLKLLKRSGPLVLGKRLVRKFKLSQKYADEDWEVPKLSPTRRKPADLRSSHGTPLSVSSDSDEVSLLERLRRIDPSEPTKRSSWEFISTLRKPADLSSSHGTPLSVSSDSDEVSLLERLRRIDPSEPTKRSSWEFISTLRKPADLSSSHGTPLSVSSDSDEVSLLERLRRIDPSEPTKRSSWEFKPTLRKPADLSSSHGTPLSVSSDSDRLKRIDPSEPTKRLSWEFISTLRKPADLSSSHGTSLSVSSDSDRLKRIDPSEPTKRSSWEFISTLRKPADLSSSHGTPLSVSSDSDRLRRIDPSEPTKRSSWEFKPTLRKPADLSSSHGTPLSVSSDSDRLRRIDPSEPTKRLSWEFISTLRKPADLSSSHGTPLSVSSDSDRLKRIDPSEPTKRSSWEFKPALFFRKPADLGSSHGTPLSVSSDSDEVSLLERLRRIDPSEPTKRSSRKFKPTQKYADEDWEIPALSPTKRKPHGTPLSGKNCELANTHASKKFLILHEETISMADSSDEQSSDEQSSEEGNKDGTSRSSSSDESVKNVVISPKKDQRSASTMVVEETDEELNYRKEHFSDPAEVTTNFKLCCTVCNTNLQSHVLDGRDIYHHPVLKVMICKMEMYKTGGGTFVPKMDETSSKLVSLLKPQFEPICSSYDSTAEYFGDDHVIYSADNDVSTSSTGLCKDDAALLLITQESAEDIETAAESVSITPTPDVASLPFEVTPRIESTKKTPRKRQSEDANCSMKIKEDETRIRLMEEEQRLKIKQMKEEHALKIKHMQEEHSIQMELWKCDLQLKRNQIQKEKD